MLDGVYDPLSTICAYLTPRMLCLQNIFSVLLAPDIKKDLQILVERTIISKYLEYTFLLFVNFILGGSVVPV